MVTVYDAEGFVISTMVCDKNVNVNVLYNSSNESQQYTIKVRLLTNKYTSYNDFISIAYRVY